MAKVTKLHKAITLEDVIDLFVTKEVFEFWYRDTKDNSVSHSDPRMETKAQASQPKLMALRESIEVSLQEREYSYAELKKEVTYLLMAWHESDELDELEEARDNKMLRNPINLEDL